MRRLFALIFLLAASQEARAVIGIGFQGGFGRIDPEDLSRDLSSAQADPAFQPAGGTVKATSFAGGGEFFWEGNSEYLRFGISTGLGLAPSAEFDETISIFFPEDTIHRIKLQTLEMPISLYAKAFNYNSRWAIWFGGGATYLRSVAQILFDTPILTLTGNFGQTKWAPHLVAGYEYFITHSLALNTNVRYLFLATMDDYRANLEVGSGFPSGEYRMIMQETSHGELIAYKFAESGLANGERPFKQNFGGVRLNLGLRYYFGEGSSLRR